MFEKLPTSFETASTIAAIVALIACVLILFVPYLALDIRIVYGGF